ncbi:MAG TPA: ABC transporter ATP-binding protein [Syntrophomonadaceae bacterium]|nr:ABC transporter ATP-binding protein [Syntrophomonadaceae bacterium]HPR93556.1 ABC transporter ATP-binding protein [Syntrophomonadaceae bacterium]
MNSLIEVQEVSFKYPGALVLDKIEFTINQGEVFCLLGPNGCGKTTLLDCILGWLKPCAGQIMLNGNALTGMSARKIAKHMAYVPQIHEKTFPYLVRDIVLMGRASYMGTFKVPSAEDIKIAENALDTVGMLKLKERPYTQLSGGEGQLVMVARALAQNTPLIIMDEPTAHLDYKHELVILETIVELIKNSRLSVLMATHIPNHCYYFENQGISTRAALIKDHRIMALGKPSEVLTEQTMGELYNIKTHIIECSLDEGEQLKQVLPVRTLNN